MTQRTHTSGASLQAPWLRERRRSLTNLLWQQCGVSFWPGDCKGSVFSGHVRAHWHPRWGFQPSPGGGDVHMHLNTHTHTHTQVCTRMHGRDFDLVANSPSGLHSYGTVSVSPIIEMKTPAASSSFRMRLWVQPLLPQVWHWPDEVSKFSTHTPDSLISHNITTTQHPAEPSSHQTENSVV